MFGSGAAAGPANRLFFTAGINGENDGLFGVIDPAPEPGSLALLTVGSWGWPPPGVTAHAPAEPGAADQPRVRGL